MSHNKSIVHNKTADLKVKVKGKGIQVLYSDVFGLDPARWDPSPPLIRLNASHAIQGRRAKKSFEHNQKLGERCKISRV